MRRIIQRTTGREARQLFSDLSLLRIENLSINTELEALRSRIRSYETELEALRSHLHSDETELEALRSHLHSDETELEALRSRIRSYETELQALRSHLHSDETELEALRSHIRSYETEQNTRKRRLHPYVQEAISILKLPALNSAPKIQPKENGNLTGLFTKYGSDKEDRHSYASTYSEILAEKSAPRILEIGLGSLNPFPYAGLAPGGSIRAWREGYPEAIIVGVDIDPDAVSAIDEVGFVADQTSDDSLDELIVKLEDFAPFDLIVDDGFHDPHANVRTLVKLFSLLSQTGSYVIEDVHESLVDLWELMAQNLPGRLEVRDLRDQRPESDDNILLIFTRS
jgi:hypothetical protein